MSAGFSLGVPWDLTPRRAPAPRALVALNRALPPAPPLPSPAATMLSSALPAIIERLDRSEGPALDAVLEEARGALDLLPQESMGPPVAAMLLTVDDGDGRELIAVKTGDAGFSSRPGRGEEQVAHGGTGTGEAFPPLYQAAGGNCNRPSAPASGPGSGGARGGQLSACIGRPGPFEIVGPPPPMPLRPSGMHGSGGFVGV